MEIMSLSKIALLIQNLTAKYNKLMNRYGVALYKKEIFCIFPGKYLTAEDQKTNLIQICVCI